MNFFNKRFDWSGNKSGTWNLPTPPQQSSIVQDLYETAQTEVLDKTVNNLPDEYQSKCGYFPLGGRLLSGSGAAYGPLSCAFGIKPEISTAVRVLNFGFWDCSWTDSTGILSVELGPGHNINVDCSAYAVVGEWVDIAYTVDESAGVYYLSVACNGHIVTNGQVVNVDIAGGDAITMFSGFVGLTDFCWMSINSNVITTTAQLLALNDRTPPALNTVMMCTDFSQHSVEFADGSETPTVDTGSSRDLSLNGVTYGLYKTGRTPRPCKSLTRGYSRSDPTKEFGPTEWSLGTVNDSY